MGGFVANGTVPASGFISEAIRQLPEMQKSLSDIPGSRALWGQIFALLLVTTVIARSYMPTFDGVKAPFAGYRSKWEPGLFVRMRFASGAFDIIQEGYNKFKNSMYKVSRNDRDLLVLSTKYVDELRNYTGDQLNSIKALSRNFGGRYGGIDILIESSLGTRALQTKVTPNLAKLSGDMHEELEFALETDVPSCKEWTSVEIQPLLLKIVARISNRIFVGMPVCRNEEWLAAAIGFSHNVTMTTMILRGLPPTLRPIAAMFMPCSYRVFSCIRKGKSIVAPEVERRRHLEATDPDYQKPKDLLQGMMDLATPGEKDSTPEDLAHRQLIMSLAAVHTTAATAAQALFDLAARPEYFDILREEVVEVLREDGGWDKQSWNKLRKMDSFIKESQRFNPPSLLGFHRIVEDPKGIKLHDGINLPYKTHLCVASQAASNDPDAFPNADQFHGLRYYEIRKNPEESRKHQLAMTDKHHLHFGHGKYSCPGRFFASNEMKMIFACFLLRYDFKYPDGQGRPKNMNIDEFLFVNPETRMMIREKPDPIEINPGVEIKSDNEVKSDVEVMG